MIEEAAALWESLAQNHPFTNGNKRTAFAATFTFLAMNGILFSAGVDETYDFISALYAANQFRFEIPWLRGNATKS